MWRSVSGWFLSCLAYAVVATAANAGQTSFSLPNATAGTGGPNAVGTLYGIPALCESYRQNSDFFDRQPYNDGIWWMDDKRLVGHEIYCDVRSKTKSEIKFLCHYEGDETEAQTSPIELGEGWIEIGGQRLEECTKPATTEKIPSVPFEDSVKAWREAIEGCGPENDDTAKSVDLSAIRQACVKLGVATTRLTDAGYCLDTKALEWSACKPAEPKTPSSASTEITLPPNAEGHWTNILAGAEIVFLENKWLQYKGHSDKGSFTENCHIESQHPTIWRYEVSCPNGISGPLTFYDTGIMEFDFTRFARTPTARSYLLSPPPTLEAPVATIGNPKLGKPP